MMLKRWARPASPPLDMSGRIQFFVTTTAWVPTTHGRVQRGTWAISSPPRVLFKTNRGELSVRQALRIPTKSLRPLPENSNGLTDQDRSTASATST